MLYYITYNQLTYQFNGLSVEAGLSAALDFMEERTTKNTLPSETRDRLCCKGCD